MVIILIGASLDESGGENSDDYNIKHGGNAKLYYLGLGSVVLDMVRIISSSTT